MNKSIKFAGILLAFASAAAASTIRFIGSPSGVNDGAFYVLPYQITIDGVNQLVTCFDALDDVNSGDIWQASILTIGPAAVSGYFPGGSVMTYQRIAWLSAQTYSDSGQQVGLQHAIWNVFGAVSQTPETLSFEAAADTAAASGYAGFDFSGFRFIQQAGMISGQAGAEQAFVYRLNPLAASSNSPIPEPGTVLLFATGLGLIVLGVKRR